MINVGNFVRVWQDYNGNLVQITKGFVHVIGNGMVEIRHADRKKRYLLCEVCLEKLHPDANELKPANLPAMFAIKNKATGNGFTRKGGKARFQKENVWESRPGRFEESNLQELEMEKYSKENLEAMIETFNEMNSYQEVLHAYSTANGWWQLRDGNCMLVTDDNLENIIDRVWCVLKENGLEHEYYDMMKREK